MHLKSKGSRPQNWIDFRELRKQLNFKDVLKAYGIELEPKGGEQYHGFCPLPHHGEKRSKSFSANLAKGIFRCFGCEASGNVIDFCVLMADLDKSNGDHVRKIALELQERFVAGKAAEQAKDGDSEQGQIINPPLDFELKTLDPAHPYFAEHKLAAETVAHFGLGFCNRGVLKGRIAIPLHDDSGKLIGYAGLVMDDSLVTAENPQYVFPADRNVKGITQVFDRSRVLYNGHRITKTVNKLFIVTHGHLAWWLWQSGFKNVVALMNDTCSDEQAEFISLLTTENGHIWLMFDENSADTERKQDIVTKITQSRFCRWVNFKVGKELSGFDTLA